METRPKFSEVETLEQYHVALDNAKTQPEISAIMDELGYDSTVIAEGKVLLAEIRTAYNLNNTEDDEPSAAYADFLAKKAQLDKIFNIHRKKAKVIFRNDSLVVDKLAISGAMPRTYIKWLEAAKRFYCVASTDTTIQGKLSRLNISANDLTTANTIILELEVARSEYLKEKGESQVATKTKDTVFAKMDDWMSEFYAVAKIGLEDKPKLLEALGKTVKG